MKFSIYCKLKASKYIIFFNVEVSGERRFNNNNTSKIDEFESYLQRSQKIF